MAISSETKNILVRILELRIESCNDYINMSETYLHRNRNQADPDYIFRREQELQKCKDRLLEFKSAIKDIQLNS